MDSLTLPPPPIPPRPATAAGPATAVDAGRSRPRPGSRWVTVALGAIVVALGAAAVTLAVRRPAPPERPRYHTETVTRGRVTGLLHATAVLEPTATIRVGAQAAARVSSVAVNVGERVRRGQPLARLDARALRAEAQGAEAQAIAAQIGLRHAEMRLGQIIFLLEHMSGPTAPRGHEAHVAELEAAAVDAEAELVTAAADLERHKAALYGRRVQLAAATLRAPIDGVVARRAVEPGDTVPAGTPLFEIVPPPGELRLIATVAEDDVARVRAGPVVFTVPALPGRVFDGLVTSVDPTPHGDRPPFSYRVRILARDHEHALRPGMRAVVALPIESASDALIVPLDALRYAPAERGPLEEGAAVHVLGTDGRPLRVPVDLGVTDGTFVELRGSRLREGASVILADGS